MSDKRANKRIRERIFDMYKQFVSEVNPDDVLDLLIQERVLSIDQKEEVMSKVTTKKRCRALLDLLLLSSNKEAFIVLREALQEQYDWIVKRIDTCEDSDSDVGEEPSEGNSPYKKRRYESFGNCSHARVINDRTPKIMKYYSQDCLQYATNYKRQKHLEEESEEEVQILSPTKICQKHNDKELDHYCCNCRTVACSSCFNEEHKSHDCRDVKTVGKIFREEFGKICSEMSDNLMQLLSRRADIMKQEEIFESEFSKKERLIRRNSHKLQTRIVQDEFELLGNLSLIRQKHHQNTAKDIKLMSSRIEALERFVEFWTSLKSRGSASEVCASAENLMSRAKKLIEESWEYLGAHRTLTEINFTAEDHDAIFSSRSSNLIGNLSESKRKLESYAVVIGRYDGDGEVSNEVMKINLSRPEDVSSLPPVPTEMQIGAAAAVYCNSIFVTGIGSSLDEVWKLNSASSSWKQCSSMVRGRGLHSVAFVNHVLYICGGFFNSDKSLLHDVEAYHALNDNCITVGKLKCGVHSSGNCVSYRDSIYIFGGLDVNSESMSSVQVYNTRSNTCSLLSKSMPRPDLFLPAVLWNNSAILIGCSNCFVYDFDTEVWQMRNRFKTDVACFGVAVANGKLFVIGGGEFTTDENGKTKWNSKDDVRSVPIWNILNDEPIEWKHHAKLTKPSLACAFGETIY